MDYTDGPLTRAEFEEKLASGNLLLTLVGMSNVGKSHWSERLARESGFTHINCDDLIEAEVAHLLEEMGYKGGIADMAKWLGQPYDEQFAKNQQTFLDLEIHIIERIIGELRESRLTGNTIIDTSGSIVHTTRAICEELKKYTTVVYLEATHDMQEEMFRLYIANPKPVVWADKYKSIAGESPTQALARCYPELLAYRSELYAEIAQVTIPHWISLNMTSVSEFLDYIKKSLPMER